MEMAYKITEVCGDWALHITPYGKTDAEMILIFNSRNNAELVKSVLEWEGAHPNAAVPYKSTLAPPNEAPPCYQPDGDGCAYQCYDGDDEPIDKCKECPLCYSDKQRHHAPPNEWVNRNVRLPEWQVDVLVLYDSGKIDINWVDGIGEFMYENIYGRVTHWMPLPAPPESLLPECSTDTNVGGTDKNVPTNEPLTCDGCACEEYGRDNYPCNCCSRNNETISDQYRPPEGEA